MPDPNLYTVGWICAISTESVAAREFLDEEHEGQEYVAQRDNNSYTLGRIGGHNVVIAVLPDGEYGKASAAGVTHDMLHSFPNIRIGLMVGVGGGAPTLEHDIRLGDIVVSRPQDGHGGVFHYDFGKTIQDQEFQTTGFLDQPPIVLRTAVSQLKARYEADGHQIPESIEAVLQRKPRLREKYGQPDLITDRLYRTHVIYPPGARGPCLTSCGSDTSLLVARCGRDGRKDNPTIHYGLIASADNLMKDAITRDRLAQEKEVLCFEMEAAGLMNHFPCLVIRGICDYSDTHKNKQWQGYAAMTAAAYAKDVLNRIPPSKVEDEIKARKLLHEMYMDISEIRDQTGKTKTRVEELGADGHHDKIRKWLQAPDPSTNFNKARDQYHEGTGRWLLDSEEYTKWKTEQNAFLWLFGIPGCGKTILSSSVVADLEQSAGSAQTLLYFYFDFSDVEKQSLDKAVRSLIQQLYSQQMSTRAEVNDLYSSFNDGGRQPDQESLRDLLRNLLQNQDDSEFWIVLDALDECGSRNENKPFGLMSYIESLRKCSANVHLLVTSRPERDIQSAIEEWGPVNQRIHLEGDRVRNDINSYINAEVSQLRTWKKRPDIQKEIEIALLDKANGMFRWVSCQMDVVSKKHTPKSVRKTLKDLPRTLDETYERILQNIDTEHQSLATRLLQFLVYSDRPLRLEEAVDAIAVDIAEEPNFDPDDRIECPEEIVRYCSSLAVLVKKKDKGQDIEIVEIQLAHLSVQEYLMSDRLQGGIACELSLSGANIALATICLSYLLSLDHSDDPKEALEKYPLAQYAAQYWPTYAAVAEQSDKRALPIARKYFSSTSAVNFCYQIYSPDRPWVDDRDEPQEAPSALYCASLSGLRYSTKSLIEDGANVNAQGGSYSDPLGAAFYSGHDEIVKILVKEGATIDGQSDEYFNALEHAVQQADPEGVQMLVDYGRNTQDIFKHFLIDASEVGNVETVQLLLDKGADVNKQQDKGATAIHLAAAKGHLEIVQLLLDKGADVNKQQDNGATALVFASAKGHREIVKLLLDKGANVNAQGRYYGDALQAALYERHHEIARILIDQGADVHFRDLSGDSALILASSRGFQEIVQLLLEMHVDVNAHTNEGVNALQAARRGGHKAIEEMLMKFGSNQAVNDSERPLDLPRLSRNKQQESHEKEQTNSNKRRRSGSIQESTAKKLHL